jgi:hypothetical protein
LWTLFFLRNQFPSASSKYHNFKRY